MRITQTLFLDTLVVIGMFVIGHLRCARSNSAKKRTCQEPMRFQNFVVVKTNNVIYHPLKTWP